MRIDLLIMLKRNRVITFVLAVLIPLQCQCNLARNDRQLLRVALWDYNHWVDDGFFDGFVKIHPEINLKVESESWSNYRSKINIQLMTNTAPDVLILKASDLYRYCDKNLLLDLTSLISEGGPNLEECFDVSVESCRWKGNYYGLPIGNFISILYLNVDLFRALGVELPADDSIATWCSFLELCKSLSDKQRLQDYGSVTTFVYLEELGWSELYSAVLQNGATPFDKSENPSKCLLNEPAALEACEYYFNISLKYGYAPTRLQYTSIFRNTPVDFFIQGKIPLYLGRLGRRFLEDPHLNFMIKAIPRPKKERRASLVETSIVAVNSRTINKTLAWELARYMLSVEAQRIIGTSEALNGVIPSLKEVARSPSYLPNHPEIREIALAELEHAVPMIKTTKVEELGFVMNPIFERLAMKQIGIKDAMDELVSNANRALSNKQIKSFHE